MTIYGVVYSIIVGLNMRLITLRAQEMWIQELYSYAKEIRVPFSHLIKFAGSKAVDSLRNSRTPAEARAIVRKHEVEITDIPISTIAEQFICHLEVLEKIDVNKVGDFLALQV